MNKKKKKGTKLPLITFILYFCTKNNKMTPKVSVIITIYNREKYIERAKKYYAENKEKRKAYASQYYQNNKQKLIERAMQWQKENWFKEQERQREKIFRDI